MIRWRLALALGLVAFAGVPVLAPLVELLRLPSAWSAWSETPRLLELLKNSFLLLSGTLAISVPVGVVAAVLFFRTDLPGRRCWQFLTLTTLFIPLPLIASAWQLVWNWLPDYSPVFSGTGMAAAISVHALASVPWIVLLAGLGMTWVEPELEEDALMLMPAWRVVVHVTLPRSVPAVVLAAMHVGLLTLNEIAVTDITQVRTFSEEVYTQMVGGGDDEVARAVAVSVPAVALATAVAWGVMRRWRRRLPPAISLLRPPRRFLLGRLRWPAFLAAVVFTVLLVGIPLTGLLREAGLRYATAAAPGPPVWDPTVLLRRIGDALLYQRTLLLQSGMLALLSGGLTGTLAFTVAWLCRGSRVFTIFAWTLAVVLWSLPGPILGIGLLDTIQGLIGLPGGGVLRALLWDRPSPVPNVWICTLRFFPLAFAAVWPMLRLLPRELEEMALLDGLGPWQRLVRVVFPILRGPWVWAVVGSGVLAVGELSASKLVTTPGFLPLSHHVFQQMHASADAELAALSIVLLLLVLAGGMLFVTAVTWWRLRLQQPGGAVTSVDERRP